MITFGSKKNKSIKQVRAILWTQLLQSTELKLEGSLNDKLFIYAGNHNPFQFLIMQ